MQPEVNQVAFVAVDHQPDPALLLLETWPIFTTELTTALNACSGDLLAERVDRLCIVAIPLLLQLGERLRTRHITHSPTTQPYDQDQQARIA
ncbi:hypothetical protein Daura_06315 [Dactylosporangium aurantiacum]|uniref:Uncharacterized protein n=1 Tax=Dactylosporangium aurantiacum TaxID=35754 RepID=A0A9Q9MNK8_9ACTN|nr:hypothetical protein [Dactylosporangium aurantiacum]UWZ55812.1 hypothetical protein Daura_06315 [Dactylosporangium aurantiacum]